ncbi:hypothetical protein SAMN04488581_2334 [Mycolicibacterium neoaurum]|uniref:hypothetical protein n=1 Tax=Mycolicibacterium neoaurum TaxID=1795 RepID=UPI0008874836|nr:hypothetical protein [Mycolicibacterium neoaurum]SDD46605.1 hypothetical protein SAMN04488581_2334 [Mycolicibacterium neoaurum]
MISDSGYSGRAQMVVERSESSSDFADLDLLIFAVGYEQRSRHIAEQWAGRYHRAIGVRFHVHEQLGFGENLQWAESQPNIAIETAGSEVAVGQLLSAACESRDGFAVAVDVSSFPRPYLAAIVSSLSRSAFEMGVELRVLFAYSVPEFTQPAIDHGPVVSFGAVHPEFVGSSEAGWSLAALIGLGYEPDLALSAQQMLDPAVTWLGAPRSEDHRFDDEISEANEILLDVVDSSNVWSYNIDDPAMTFFELESIVSGLVREHNVVLVPLGPKIFTVTCLLVALAHERAIGIWRISAGGLRTPKDQVAAGPIYCLAVKFQG